MEARLREIVSVAVSPLARSQSAAIGMPHGIREGGLAANRHGAQTAQESRRLTSSTSPLGETFNLMDASRFGPGPWLTRRNMS